jgi:hypothetical protein
VGLYYAFYVLVKQDPISKINNAKRAGGVAQTVDHLPSKWKALSSALRIAKEVLLCIFYK